MSTFSCAEAIVSNLYMHNVDVHMYCNYTNNTGVIYFDFFRYVIA